MTVPLARQQDRIVSLRHPIRDIKMNELCVCYEDWGYRRHRVTVCQDSPGMACVFVHREREYVHEIVQTNTWATKRVEVT